MQGKTKSKLSTNKEDQIPDETPEEVLRSLSNIGYIEENDVKNILIKLSTPKPSKTLPKKNKPKDTKAASQPRNQPINNNTIKRNRQ